MQSALSITNIFSEAPDLICITWNDGVTSRYGCRFLRGRCPCAECVDEISGQRVVFPEDIPEGVRATDATPVGRYAYQFYWSDGHNTGLYTYKYLRQLGDTLESGEQSQPESSKGD